MLQSNQYHIKWTSCTDLPCKLYSASIAVSTDYSRVYVTAGSAPDNIYNNVYCYSTQTDNWITLPQPGHHFGVLHIIDDELNIFGGGKDGEYDSKVTTYISEANNWSSCYPNMRHKRFKPGVVTHRNYMIVMGGINSPDSIHDSIEIMDFHHHRQWKEVSNCLPVPMYAIKPTLSGDNITVVGYAQAGGRSNGYYQIPIEQIIFTLDNPLASRSKSSQWKELSSAIHWNTATIPYSNPPVTVGGKVHENEGSNATSDISLYDPSKDSWRKVDSLTSARDCVAVATLDSSTIIVIGGTSGGSGIKQHKASSVATVEIGKIVPNL